MKDDYTEYNGTRVDYNVRTGELDQRLYNKRMGYMNPRVSEDTEYEPEFYDPDLWD